MKLENTEFIQNNFNANFRRFSNLKNLTIVIPSYERPDFILRQIAYWSGSGASLIVVDGSEKPLMLKTQKTIKTLRNIVYLHSPVTVCERFELAAELITTDFAIYCSEDDFLLHSAVSKGVEFLIKNQDFVACAGQTLRFDVLGNNSLTFDNCYSFKNNKFDNYKTRIDRMTLNYNSISCSSVMRSETWKNAWGNIPNFSSSIILEIYQSFIVHISGKLKVIENLFLLRTLENLPMSTPDNNRKIGLTEWWHSDQYSCEREIFIEKLAVFSQITHGATKNEMRNFLTESMDRLGFHLRDVTLMNLQLGNLVKLFFLKFQIIKNLLRAVRRFSPSSKVLDLGGIADLNLNQKLDFKCDGETTRDLLLIEGLISLYYRSGGTRSSG